MCSCDWKTLVGQCRPGQTVLDSAVVALVLFFVTQICSFKSYAFQRYWLFRDTGLISWVQGQTVTPVLSSHELQPMPSSWWNRVVIDKCLCCALDLQSPFSGLFLTSIWQVRKLKPIEVVTGPESSDQLVRKLGSASEFLGHCFTPVSHAASLDYVRCSSPTSFFSKFSWLLLQWAIKLFCFKAAVPYWLTRKLQVSRYAPVWDLS